jgi:hypothetical protein
MDHLDVVTTILYSEIDNEDMYITLPEGWQEDLNTLKIIVRLRKALHGHKHAPQLWHDDINPFLLSLVITPSSVDPNLHLCSDGILRLQYVNNISMSYPEVTTKAKINAKANLSEKYKITNLGLVQQFFGIEIHSDCTAISLCQKADNTTILRAFGKLHTHAVSTPINPNIQLDLAEQRGEKELNDSTDYQVVVGSLMYIALATQPDI